MSSSKGNSPFEVPLTTLVKGAVRSFHLGTISTYLFHSHTGQLTHQLRMSLYTYPSGEITLLPPPDGFIANFADPERQYVTALYWAAGVLSFITLLFVAQRMYTSLVIQKKFLLEDGLLLCGWLLIILETVLILRTVAQGLMGTHAYELELSRFLKYLKEFYPMPIIYPLCMMFGKLSLLVFYTRLSPVLAFKIAAYFGIFGVFASFFSLTFATAFPCKPIALAWNPLIAGSCINRPATYKATAILGLLSDFYLIILPLPTIVGLQMPWQQKAGLIAMFGVGIVTIFTSIMRLIIIIKELSNEDVSWGSAPTAFWLVIEAHLMIICASLPSLRKFFRHIAPKIIGERRSTSGSDPGPQRNPDLITFGRLGKKKYKQFDSAYGLDTINDVPYGLQTWNHVDITGDAQHNTESQTGILETRTATVTRQLEQEEA